VLLVILAARATPARTVTISWPTTSSRCSTRLHIAKADVVGWSDGAILGVDLAIRHPDRVGKVFAFAANTVTSGVQEGVEKNPTFARFIERAGHEYSRLSAMPKAYEAFVAQISKMWAEPNWTDAHPSRPRRIRGRVIVS
jgi:pimeloyl-ACP methyl ester carboxylesterase